MAMRPEVTYTPYATSSKEQTGNVITYAKFEEGNLLAETCHNTESSDESDSESIMVHVLYRKLQRTLKQRR